MKHITKAGIIAASAVLLTQAAQAQFTNNDLYLGFTKSSASADYIVDLGQASSLSFSGTTPLNLDGDFSLDIFESIFSNPVGVGVGVVGGINQFPSSHDMYYTAPVGMDMSSETFAGLAVGAVARLDTGVDTGKSWAANIPVFSANDFYGASGVNPDYTVQNSDLLGNSYEFEESIWEATPSGSTFVGNIVMDVPEPSVVSLLGGCGALLGILRWRKVSQNA